MQRTGPALLALTVDLARREILARYRGTILGAAWSLVTPLLMLTVFTFTFGTVFPSRWQPALQPVSTGPAPSLGEFAVILFVGLIVFNFFSDVVNRAPGLILAHTNYVKKVVFPLEVLPVAAVCVALYNAAVSVAVLLAFRLAVYGSLPPTALLLPLVLAPFVVFTLGLAWFLASLGVYLRDTSQVLPPMLTALMFLTPIFFPAAALPDWVRGLLFLNPLTLPIEQARKVLIWGQTPDLSALAIYAVLSCAAAGLGLAWFQMTRRGFADVL